MKVTSRERAAVAAAAMLGVIVGGAWLSVGALAQQGAVSQPAAPATATPPTGNVEQLAVRDTLDGPILDPFTLLSERAGASSRKPPNTGNAPARLGPIAVAPPLDFTPGGPANPMGFPQFVPPMVTTSTTAAPPADVYALGTGTAMLAPGGPLLRAGDRVGALRVTKIDGTGVYLENGAILRQRSAVGGAARGPGTAVGGAATGSAPAANLPQPSPSPSPSAIPVTVGPQSASPPTSASAAMQALLFQRQSPRPIVGPSTVPGGTP